jgi:hypothetical protein
MFHIDTDIWGIMPKHVNRKKRVFAIVTAAVLVLGGGSAAFAYWTTTGSGTGSATTGTTVNWTITSTTAGAALTPGGPIDTATFIVTNPGTGVQNLAAVTAAVANADGTPWVAVSGCSAADYTVGTPTFSTGNVNPGATVTGTVTIQMINRAAVNQDGCKLATVPLYFTAS